MVYTFARINAVLQMKVADYFIQGRRGWVRLHEKGGKEHEVPCGFSHNGLPIGLMIAGPRFSEGKVLALARAYEQSTDWHTKQPPITPKSAVPALAETEDK